MEECVVSIGEMDVVTNGLRAPVWLPMVGGVWLPLVRGVVTIVERGVVTNCGRGVVTNGERGVVSERFGLLRHIKWCASVL